MHEAAHNLTREELQGCLNDFSNISNRMAWSNMPSSRPKVMPNAWAELSNSMIHACKKYGIPVPYWLGEDEDEEPYWLGEDEEEENDPENIRPD